MLSARIAAKAAGCRVETMYKYLKDGIVTGKRPGKRGPWRISRESLLRSGLASEEDIQKAEGK